MRNYLGAGGCGALLGAALLAGCGGSTQASATGGGAGTSGSGASGGSSAAGEGAGGGQTSDSAEWPMPNSAGLGLPNSASYDADSTPGVVHDLVTELDWLQNPGIELYAQADAARLCAELSFAGFDDWRLPAFIELVSLFDVVPNDADPLDPIYISPTFRAEGRFWSASAVGTDGLGRLVDFTAADCGTSQYCSVGVAARADSALGGAFCVRSSQPPITSARYETTSETVTDLRTGLNWQAVAADLQTVGYTEAVAACAALGNGARLPSITELLSILVPRLDSKAFPNWPSDAFAWTSSAIPVKSDYFWAGANGGATKAALSASHNRVQCVR